MNPHDAYTRLLGLALRGGHLATGSDAVQSAAYAKDVRLLVLSADASERTRRDARLWAERGQCLYVSLPCGKAELGQALGRGEVSVAAVTDTGLAAAVAERLAQLDSARYAETAQRLKQKVRRAAERRMVRARSRPDAVRKDAQRPAKQDAQRPQRPAKQGVQHTTPPQSRAQRPAKQDAQRPAKSGARRPMTPESRIQRPAKSDTRRAVHKAARPASKSHNPRPKRRSDA